MTKKDYELIESILKYHIETVMTRNVKERGIMAKVSLQDLVADFATEFRTRDPKFRQMDFYDKTGALTWLQNG